MEEKNYTPLDLSKFGNQKHPKQSKLNTILLVIATLTAAVFAALLLILIRKKMEANINNSESIENKTPSRVNNLPPSPTPTMVVSPTMVPLSPSISSSKTPPLVSPTQAPSDEKVATGESENTSPTPTTVENNSSGSAQVGGN